jgi:hypothetical protein
VKYGNSKQDRTCATLKLLAIMVRLTTLQFTRLKHIIIDQKCLYLKGQILIYVSENILKYRMKYWSATKRSSLQAKVRKASHNWFYRVGFQVLKPAVRAHAAKLPTARQISFDSPWRLNGGGDCVLPDRRWFMCGPFHVCVCVHRQPWKLRIKSQSVSEPLKNGFSSNENNLRS